MTELTLISHEDIALQPLIEGAISEALRSTQSGINRCQERIQAFEQQYSMTASEFLQRYENDELQETLELDEWIGEIRMFQRLQEKVTRLRGVEFVH
jgi:archaellum component FlaC